jgi:membrane protease YdiL (CAAX protease family)
VAALPPPAGRPGLPALPARALGVALVGLMGSFALAATAGITAEVVTGELTAVLLAGQAGLWGGLLATVWYASRRYGSGSVVRDLGFRFARRDVLVGLGVSVLARLAAAAAAAVVLVALGEEAAIPDQLEPFRQDRTALMAALVLAVVGAPIVEELYFRGLVMGALRPLVGRAAAIAVQGALFAVLHAQVTGTLTQNLALVAALWGVGVVLGVTAHRAGRLGPAVWAHAWFNLATAVVVFAA